MLLREIKEPLTQETLGKYIYNFYFCTKVINDKEDKMLRKRDFNCLTKLMLNFIARERYIEDRLCVRILKKNKKILITAMLNKEYKEICKKNMKNVKKHIKNVKKHIKK